MKCPVDGTTLSKHSLHSVEIEECQQCRGLWFERGELRRAKDLAEPDIEWLDFDLWSDQDALEVSLSSHKCPLCGKNMAAILYANTGVTVDYCVEEHGVWLEEREFETIIESLKTELLSKSPPDYISASLEEAKEIITGDEGFISEWKDFLTVTRFLQYRVLIGNTKIAKALIALQTSTPT
jgi:Zn-finger nucleic acid-binding protein